MKLSEEIKQCEGQFENNKKLLVNQKNILDTVNKELQKKDEQLKNINLIKTKLDSLEKENQTIKQKNIDTENKNM